MKKSILAYSFALTCALSASAADLHINNRDYAVDTIVPKHLVGPGTSYAYYRVPERPLEIHVLEMDLTNPYLNFEVWNGGNAAVACETPTNAGKRYEAQGVDVIAVHNGDFFSTTLGETGISRMGLVGAGEVIFNPTGNPLFCMDNDGVPRVDYVNFSGSVTDGTSTLRLHTVNQLRLEWEPATAANQLSLYTPAFGKATHTSSTGGYYAVIRPVAGSNIYPANTPLQMQVVSVAPMVGTQTAAIPEDGAILHGVGTSADFISALTPESTITITLGASMPSYPDVTTIHDAIGGSGHIILRNGQILNINNPDLHPRTFMGVSQDKKTVYSVVVDGRYGGSAGIDLDDQGRVLQWLGAWDGLNLDGGGSSCMVVNGVIRNHTSDGSERAVGNGVILYSTAPQDDVVNSIYFSQYDWQIPVGAKVSPSISGFNRYDYLITDHLEGVSLSCDPEIGTIAPDGVTFIAGATPAKGKLTATAENGATTSVNVEICPIEAVPSFQSYIIDNRRDYPLQFTATSGYNTYPVDATTMKWSVADENIATLTDGNVRGVNNGTTTLSAVSDHFTGDITVTTENAPLSGILPIFTPSEITTKQTGASNLTVTDKGNDAFTLTYTGTGTARGAYIQLNAKGGANMVTYGLPDAIQITINPGDAPINQIRLNYQDNHGKVSAISISATPLEANKEVTIIKSLSDILDVTDNSNYPITFQGLRFEMGTSAKNQEYTISVPAFLYRYNGEAGVEDITPDAPNSAKPDNNILYRLDGSAVSGTPAPGLYIRSDGTKTILK